MKVTQQLPVTLCWLGEEVQYSPHSEPPFGTHLEKLAEMLTSVVKTCGLERCVLGYVHKHGKKHCSSWLSHAPPIGLCGMLHAHSPTRHQHLKQNLTGCLPVNWNWHPLFECTKGACEHCFYDRLLKCELILNTWTSNINIYHLLSVKDSKVYN